MKADISDAPERVIRRHHKRGALHVAIYLLIAAVATTGAFQLVNRPLWHRLRVQVADKSNRWRRNFDPPKWNAAEAGYQVTPASSFIGHAYTGQRVSANRLQ